jgi:dihydroorotase
MARRTVIRGARIIDPGQGLDETRCLVIEDGRIAGLPKRPPTGKRATEIDGRGRWVLPGFIDLHVHLREPGHEYKETVETGARSAVAGGFTTVVAMPNTSPANDSVAVTELILDRARTAGLARVLPAGAITKGLAGRELSEMGELKAAGCVIFTDDGRPVMEAGVMRRAMEYAAGLEVPVMIHAEDLTLSRGGAMHEGEVSTRLGLPGIPAAAEDVMVVRDISLLEETGGHLHVAHLSTAGAVRAVKEAKRRKLKVTCEVTPHHFSLTDEACGGYDTHTKMMPPLRGEADRRAVIEGMRQGIVEAIATDHAPHSPVEKDVEFDRAANGVVGLETAFSLTLKLVRDGELPLTRAIELLTTGPAGILGLSAGTLAPGAAADVVLVDPEAEWQVVPERFHSKSRNTPFAGWTLPGRVLGTWVGGRQVHAEKDGKSR